MRGCVLRNGAFCVKVVTRNSYFEDWVSQTIILKCIKCIKNRRYKSYNVKTYVENFENISILLHKADLIMSSVALVNNGPLVD